MHAAWACGRLDKVGMTNNRKAQESKEQLQVSLLQSEEVEITIAAIGEQVNHYNHRSAAMPL